MFGPVSGTGRAMMASLQQAVQKGMPPDQAVQYVKSMATQGVAPLADLYAMMNQFQRLKQPQAQAPQTPPTIKDQLNMLDQQQQMQRQQGNIQQMQAPAPQPSPMDRGLGAIDAGNMEYPQFAGGGVVALAGGGEPDLEAEVQRILQKSPVFRTPEENEILRAAGRQLSRRELPSDSGISKVDKYLGQIFGDEQETRPAQTPTVTPSQSAVPAAPALGGAGFDQQIAAARAGVQQDMPPAVPPAASPFAPPSGAGRAGASQPPSRAMSRPDFMTGLDEYRGSEGDYIAKQLREQEALDKQYGLGKESEAYKARLKQVDEMTKDRGKREEEDRRMDRAEFFFNIAAQAAQPGATFMGSVAKAGPGFAKASRETTSRLRDLQERAQEAQLRLMEAEQLRKEGNVKGAQQAFASGQKQMIDTGIKLYEIQKQEQQNIRTTNAMISQSDPGGLRAIEGDLARQIAAGAGTPQSRLEAIRGAGKSTASDAAYRKNLLVATNREISDAQRRLSTVEVAYNPQLKADAERRLRDATETRQNLLAEYPDLLEAVGGGGGSGSMGRLRFNPETGLIE